MLSNSQPRVNVKLRLHEAIALDSGFLWRGLGKLNSGWVVFVGRMERVLR